MMNIKKNLHQTSENGEEKVFKVIMRMGKDQYNDLERRLSPKPLKQNSESFQALVLNELIA